MSLDIDRAARLQWHKIVCWVVSAVARVAFGISKRIHLPFLKLGEHAVDAHNLHAAVVNVILREYIAELERAIAIKETREAWEQRHQP